MGILSNMRMPHPWSPPTVVGTSAANHTGYQVFLSVLNGSYGSHQTFFLALTPKLVFDFAHDMVKKCKKEMEGWQGRPFGEAMVFCVDKSMSSLQIAQKIGASITEATQGTESKSWRESCEITVNSCEIPDKSLLKLSGWPNTISSLKKTFEESR